MLNFSYLKKTRKGLESITTVGHRDRSRILRLTWKELIYYEIDHMIIHKDYVYVENKLNEYDIGIIILKKPNLEIQDIDFPVLINQPLNETLSNKIFLYGYGKTRTDAKELSEFMLRMDVLVHMNFDEPGTPISCTFLYEVFCFRGAQRGSGKQFPDEGDSGGPIIYRRTGIRTLDDGWSETFNQTVLVGLFSSFAKVPVDDPLAYALNMDFFNGWTNRVIENPSDKKKLNYPGLYSCCESFDDYNDYDLRKQMREKHE